jgi:ubiquinone/menaquinone biosynthesis C-methylase UbiE
MTVKEKSEFSLMWLQNNVGERKLVQIKDFTLDVGCGENAKGNVNIDQYVPKKIPMNFILCSAEKLPFQASFDCVRSSYVIEHLLDPVNFINECTKIAKKRVVIITDNSDWVGEFYFRLVGSGRIFHPEHCYKWSVEYMRTLLSRLGIKAVVTPCNLSPTSIVKIFSSFGKLPRIGILFYRDISVEINKAR